MAAQQQKTAGPGDAPLVLQEVRVTLHQKLIRKANCNSRGLRVPFMRPKVESNCGGAEVAVAAVAKVAVLLRELNSAWLKVL
jgi:hypothetical protein